MENNLRHKFKDHVATDPNHVDCFLCDVCSSYGLNNPLTLLHVHIIMIVVAINLNTHCRYSGLVQLLKSKIQALPRYLTKNFQTFKTFIVTPKLVQLMHLQKN